MESRYVSGYTWSAGSGGYVYPGASDEAHMLFPNLGYTNILVARYNACGQEDWYRKEIYVSDGGIGFFSTYPNPASNTLTVERIQQSREITERKTVLASNITVQLYNQSHQLVRELSANNERLSLDVSNLPDGAYFLNILENGKVVEQQTVVVKH